MKTKLMKTIYPAFILSLLCSVAIVVGCKKEESQTPQTVQAPIKLKKFDILLDWQAEPTYIGVYYAKELGLFQQLGLDVNIIQSWGANAAVSAVAAGKYEIATASGGATVLGCDNTANIVSLGVLYPKIPSVLYGLAKNELSSPNSLKGKRIGLYPGSITVNEFNAFVTVNKINTNDFSVISISGADIPLLVSGSVDFVLHYHEMSPAFVETSPDFSEVNGRKASELSLAEWGVKGYGLNVITSKSALATDKETIIKISAAIFEGYRKACENPDDAAKTFAKLFPEKNPAYIKESLKRVCDLISGNFGTQTEQGWQETIDMYQNLGLLKHPVQPKDLLP